MKRIVDWRAELRHARRQRIERTLTERRIRRAMELADALDCKEVGRG